MEQTPEKQDLGHEEIQNEEPKETPRRISPSAVRIMVILYILWIAKDVFSGVLRNETDGASPVLLTIAMAILVAGALGLAYVEWRNYKNRKKK